MRAERVGARDDARPDHPAWSARRGAREHPIQRLADVVSSYFVPAVVIIAMITFVAWAFLGPQPRLAHALVNAVAVLIIACPCALGLATPMSIMVGTGRGAAAGVLIKNAEALEVLERVNTLVIDKTGTLTEGKPRVVSVVAMPGQDEGELLRLAAGVEVASEHPLAAAVAAAARERGLSRSRRPNHSARSPAKGLKGKSMGRAVVVGNRSLLEELGIAVRAFGERAEALHRDGQTVVFIAVDGRPAGLIGIADPIKDSAAAAIEDLRKEGLRVIMLTGDNRTTAEAVGRQLGAR